MKIKGIVEDYEARLRSLDQKIGGGGKSEWERIDGGAEEFEVKIRALDLPDGTMLGVMLESGEAGRMTVENGKAVLDLRGTKGASIPRVKAGDRIRIFHEERTILEGIFEED